MSEKNRSLGREVASLAVPAFATLVSEPLLVLADSAIIGHWNTDSLAGLGIAANAIGVVVGLSVFLAYGTTATVARRLGAGDRRGALASGLDGIVLAVLIGAVLAAAVAALAGPIVALYGPGPVVAQQAVRYLRIIACGLPAALVTLASTGVLRGLQDTRTPLAVTVTANLVNIGLNLSLVWGARLGIAGSGLGTVISQYAAAAVMARVVTRGARRSGVRWRFRPQGVLGAARSAGWLVMRSASLQASLLLTTRVAAGLGPVTMATHQVINGLWGLLTYAMDAVGIAAQAIIGRHLGAGQAHTATRLTWLMVRWGIAGGVVLGALLWVLHPLYAGWFTADPAVRELMGQVIPVLAVMTPIGGLVFVLDGVLIGAGDMRYLAWAILAAFLVYLPIVETVGHLGLGLPWLWAGYACYLAARGLTLVLRARTDHWQRLGA